jgi:hypothetical protein
MLATCDCVAPRHRDLGQIFRAQFAPSAATAPESGGLDGEMTRFMQWLAGNIDALLALVVAMVIVVLGLLDVGNLVGSDVVQNSTLAVLALLSGVLLRDRFQQLKIREEVVQRIASVADAVDLVPARVDQLIAEEPVLQDLRATLQEAALIRVVSGSQRRQLADEAIHTTDRWVCRGGTGAVLASTVLPRCIDHARRESRPLHVRVEVLNPLNLGECESYARFAQSMPATSDSRDGPWTVDRVRREVFATVLAACWHRQRYGLLNVEIGLSGVTTTLQWEITSHWALLGSTDPEAPVLLAQQGSPFYARWAADLQHSLNQAQRLPLEAARAFRLGDEPTIEDTRRLFSMLGVPLPSTWDERNVSDVIIRAVRPPGPPFNG